MTYRRSRFWSVLALLVFFAMSALVFAWLYDLSGGRAPLSTSYRVAVVLPDGYALDNGADVRAAGVRIGRVADVEPSGQASRVTMEIDEREAPLPRDSTVALRTRTLVGENAIDVTIGDARKGIVENGGTLPLTAAEESVQIDQVLRTLSPRTREDVRATLRALGRATRGRGGDVNRAVAGARDLTEDGADVAHILAARDRQLARVLADGASVLRALGARDQALRDLITDARTAASAVAARDSRLRGTLARLPRALRSADRGAEALGALGRTGTPVADDLTVAARRLTPAVRALGPAARDARRLTRRLPALSRSLAPVLARLRAFSVRAQPVVGPLRSALRRIAPLARDVAPYARDLGAWFANLGAAADTYDANGHALRVQLLFDEQTLVGALPPRVQALLDDGKGAGPIAAIGPTSVNPYPAAGSSGGARR